MDIGVIGTGVMGKNHVRVYSEMKSVDNLYVYDVDINSAQKAAESNDAIVASSIKELLCNTDAVSVCVPTKHHYEVVKEVLKTHKHDILIEKPICSTSAEASKLLQTDYYTVMIGTGHIERFNPIVAEIKKIVKNPLYIEFKRHNPASARVTGSSVVEDLMIHDIDILINELFTTLPNTLYSVGNDDICSVLMRYGDIPVALSASRKASKKIRSVYIEEQDFTIEGDFMSQEITIYRKPEHYKIEGNRYNQENIIEKVVVNKIEPLKYELTRFLNCVKYDDVFPVTPIQAIGNLKMCEQIKRSLV
jgi:predicted dehydrogenase